MKAANTRKLVEIGGRVAEYPVKLQPGAVERGRAGHARGRASSDKVNNWPQEWMVVGKWAKPSPE